MVLAFHKRCFFLNISNAFSLLIISYIGSGARERTHALACAHKSCINRIVPPLAELVSIKNFTRLHIKLMALLAAVRGVRPSSASRPRQINFLAKIVFIVTRARAFTRSSLVRSTLGYYARHVKLIVCVCVCRRVCAKTLPLALADARNGIRCRPHERKCKCIQAKASHL